MHHLNNKLVIEMGYSRKEFLHNFPAAAGELPYEIKQNTIQIIQSHRQLLITLGEDSVRRIGSLVIPRIQVTFQFANYSSEEQAHFMEQFRRHYHKGGG